MAEVQTAARKMAVRQADVEQATAEERVAAEQAVAHLDYEKTKGKTGRYVQADGSGSMHLTASTNYVLLQ